MSLEAAIRALALAQETIADAVETRVRPLVMAQDEDFPFLTYSVRKDPTAGTLADGAADWQKAAVEIGIYALTYDQCVTLSDALRAGLDQYANTIEDTDFAPLSLEDETEIEEAFQEGEEHPVYVRVQTYSALYRPTP